MIRSLLQFLAILVALLHVQFNYGQGLIQYNYTESEGLPSNNVYYILQASNGFLWFGTNQGVSKFDGQNFTNFNVSDGLLNDDVFILSEDPKGNIWLGSFTSGLCFIENDSVNYFKFNHKIDEIIQSKTVKQSLFFDSSGTVYLGDAMHNMLQIGPNGEINTLGQSKRNVFEFGEIVFTSSHKNKLKSKSFVVGQNIFNFFHETSLLSSFKFLTPKNTFNVNSGSHYAIKYNKEITLICQGNVYIIKEKDSISNFTLPYSTDCIYKDKNERIWIGTRGQGVYVYKDYALKQLDKVLLDGLTVTHVTEDFQGGIWCSTLEEGVFHFPYIKTTEPNLHSLPNTEIRDLIEGPKKSVFILFTDGDVWEYNGEFCQKISAFDKSNTNEQNVIYFDSITSTLFLKRYADQSPKKLAYQIRNIPLIEKSSPKSATYQFIVDSHGEEYDFRGRGLYRSEQGVQTYQYGEELEYNRIQSILSVKDTIWLGTMKGLYHVVDDKLNKFDSEIMSDKKIVAMSSYYDKIAFAIEDLGIVIQNGGKTVFFGSKDGFLTLKFTSISYDDKGVLYIATRDGMYHLNENSENWNLTKVSGQQGVSQTKINCILSLGEMIYMGTEFGLKSIHRNSLKDVIIPPILSCRIDKINGQNHVFNGEIDLPYSSNSIEVAFTSIDFAEKRKSLFKWKFNQEKEWHLTDNSKVYFDRLAPGNYLIQVKSSVLSGVWSEEAQLSFKISPPFWRTWWFILLSSLSFLCALIFLFKWRSNKIKEESKKELRLLKEKADLEMKALRAQMNPHFIFNTLTSIQYLINSNQNEQAEYYLEKFSRLLRLVVDNTEESFVTLLEELDMIRIYVDLENLRYDDKVEFNLHMPTSMKIENIKIPGMILQPFIENAIEHGLSKKEGKGKLDLTISAEKNILHIAIKDDGIGRKKAREFVQNGGDHKSVGMSNVFRRIKLMNREIDDLEGKIEVLDLVSDEGKPSGTQVNIDVKYTLK